MSNARARLDQLEHLDWEKMVDMAMEAPPRPWELAAWIGHYGRAFLTVYKGRPLRPDLPEPVRVFLDTLDRVTPIGRPCRDERHLVKVRQAWLHAVARLAFDLTADQARLAKADDTLFRGRRLMSETPAMAALDAIAASSGVDVERARNLVYPRKK